MPEFLDPDPTLVRTNTPRTTTYRNAAATPFRQEGRRFSGALYEESGALIRRVQRMRGKVTKYHPCDPETFVPQRESEIVRGQGYYIGNIMAHYGHFITEGISFCWAVDSQPDYYLAHPFIWGQIIPSFAQDALRRIGVPPERVRVIEDVTRFESLTVPDRLWHINHSVNRRFDSILEKLTAGYLRRRPTLRLYLSRGGISRRSVGNERDIEELFREAGFVVIQPQNYSLGAQLELYGQADMLAGLAGSALHNVIFCPKGAAVISVGDSRTAVTRTQPVCGALAGGVTAVIPFAEDRQGFHVPTLAAELSAVLEQLDQRSGV